MAQIKGNSINIDPNQINYARVLQVLREHGSASRSELTRATGLSPATVTGITRDLINQGYIRVGESVNSGRGRPSESLIYDAESRFALGIELHNHAVYGVVTDLYARPLLRHRLELVADGTEAVVTAIQQWAQAVLPALDGKDCAAIGVAVPGFVDPVRGLTVFSTQFGLPPNVPIVDLLEQALGQRPAVTNRTYAAALAEVWLGVAREARNVVYIRLGDDIGGAILINGLPYWGSASNGAASIAHIMVDPEGQICRCGSRGCLDTVASGRAMARKARAAIKEGRYSSLEERCGGNLNLITGEMVIEEAQHGDALAYEAFRETARWLGRAVGICINLLGPDTVILGGKLGRMAGDEFTAMIAETARAHIYSVSYQSAQIIASALGVDAVACGAAATALWSKLTQSIELHVS